MNLQAVQGRLIDMLPLYESALRAAHADEPALRDLGTVESLTALITKPRGGAPDEEGRMRAVLALLRRYQKSRHPLWSSALAVAFMPMLKGLRRRLHCPIGLRDDAEQIVLDAFYAEAMRVHVVGFGTIAVLRRAVVRAAFATVRAWHRSSGEEAGSAEVAVVPDLDLVVDMNRSFIDFELVDTAGVALRAQVDFAHNEVAPDERRRLYQRVKRQRSRERARHRQALPLAA